MAFSKPQYSLLLAVTRRNRAHLLESRLNARLDGEMNRSRWSMIGYVARSWSQPYNIDRSAYSSIYAINQMHWSVPCRGDKTQRLRHCCSRRGVPDSYVYGFGLPEASSLRYPRSVFLIAPARSAVAQIGASHVEDAHYPVFPSRQNARRVGCPECQLLPALPTAWETNHRALRKKKPGSAAKSWTGIWATILGLCQSYSGAAGHAA